MKVFSRIEAEIRAEWPLAGVAVHHRIGRLAVGDASVAIAAVSAHRDEAFRVCRYTIERVKQVLPVWKHEYFDDGDAWVEGAVADVEDDTARARAREVACA
jgi:molybdopterin synthase catalytic subunit